MALFARLLAPCRRCAPSTPARPPPLPPTRARRLLYPATFLLGAAAGVVLYSYTAAPPPRLNPDTFTPYTLASHTPITTAPSQTSILTLLPPPSPLLPFSPVHLQSIEIKHPQLQIARSYTPLPSDSTDGAIRLLVKLEPTGEMSRYLFSLPPTATIELRGPHNEYSFPLSDEVAKTLFLAGGTGIAPALQAAQKILSSSKNASMRILWAVRNRAETEGPAAEEVERLKTRFGGRLQVGLFVDGEGGIRRGVVVDGVKGWGAKRVLVSGPEGFIAYWAGRKGPWVRGSETQGIVGGVLGQLVGDSGVEVWKL